MYYTDSSYTKAQIKIQRAYTTLLTKQAHLLTASDSSILRGLRRKSVWKEQLVVTVPMQWKLKEFWTQQQQIKKYFLFKFTRRIRKQKQTSEIVAKNILLRMVTSSGELATSSTSASKRTRNHNKDEDKHVGTAINPNRSQGHPSSSSLRKARKLMSEPSGNATFASSFNGGLLIL